ncbi:MAG: xanthine dehydrogenase family protein subunit M [Burkholderiales bacterium]|nr:xanthine dehydrogenase family protein subunit M [Burkholderiales bacterium]
MRAFKLVSATDSAQAVALLAEHGPGVKVLAGGTDLLVDLKAAPEAPAVVLDISRAADMKGIAATDAGLRIGALVTHGELTRSPLVRELAPVLAEAARTIGAVQTRNLGTLGGNLVSGVPSMDSGPALIALEARVTVAGPRGTRTLGLAEFFVGPRRTALAPDELLVDVVVPAASLGKPAGFLKSGLRKGQALALVNVAAALWIDPDRGAFRAPRIALGAVAPTVIRAPRAEAYLEGRAVTAEAMAEAGRIAATEARPIGDFRASADYRRELVAVLTRRALAAACDRAEGAQ